jgi:hypothetical protein
MTLKNMISLSAIGLILIVVCLGFFAVDKDAGNALLNGIVITIVVFSIYLLRKKIRSIPRKFILIGGGLTTFVFCLLVFYLILAPSGQMGDEYAPAEEAAEAEQSRSLAFYSVGNVETVVETGSLTNDNFSAITTVEDVTTITCVVLEPLWDYDRPVNLTLSVDAAREGVSVNFYGEIELDDPNTILLDFGDGDTSANEVATHFYPPGDYAYTLEVTAQDGSFYSVNGSLNVSIKHDDVVEYRQDIEAEKVGLLIREVDFYQKKSRGGDPALADLVRDWTDVRVSLPELPRNTFFEVGTGYSLEILPYQDTENVTWVNNGNSVKFSYVDPRWKAFKSALSIFSKVDNVGSFLVMAVGFVISFIASQVFSPLLGEVIKGRFTKKKETPPENEAD